MTPIKTTRPCPISGSSEAYVAAVRDRHGKELRNVVSATSGLVYVDPIPFEDTEQFYKDDYRESYKGVSTPKGKHVYRAGKLALGRYDLIKRHLKPSMRMLDAGSSSGEFLYLLDSLGYDAEGIEANRGYAEYAASELSVNVHVEAFSKLELAGDFDAITMFHVLEHLENPIDDIHHLAGHLKDGGLFIIEVPNITYPNMAFRNKWHPGHLFSYTVETLGALFQKAGFSVVECRELGDGGNLFGIFRKTPGPDPDLGALKDQASTTLARLASGNRSYYLKPSNYFKAIGKLLKSGKEKSAAKGLAPREILDQLYSAAKASSAA